jgi:predicted PurR-regulated permease PerM
VPVSLQSLALAGLLAVAALHALRVARPFLLPVVIAVLASFLLAPLVSRLCRWRVPRGLAAASVLVALVGVVVLALSATLAPANEWLNQAPDHLSQLEARLNTALRPVEQVEEAAAQVEKLATLGVPEPTVKVSDKVSLGESIVSRTWSLLASSVVVLALLLFLLATKDPFLRKLVRILPRLEDKRRAVCIAGQIQRDISSHLSTITLINIGLGLCVWAAMSLLGMPSPLLWGVMCAALNFVPYLGAVVGMLIVGAVALLTFDDTWRALAVPLTYGVATGVEGNLLTPAVLGRRLSLDPIVVFLALLFWGWVWGIPGFLLAVPMLLVGKTICDHVPCLATIGDILDRPGSPSQRRIAPRTSP